MSESKSTKKLKPTKAVEFSVNDTATQESKPVMGRPSSYTTGRPTDYTIEIADDICYRIVQGESLNSICKTDGMPDVRSVYRWLRLHDEFSQLYARAKEDQADTLADEIQDISDERPMMTIVTDDETIEKLDAVGINRNRLRVDARKWIAAKLKPRKYGDRQIIAGDAENPLAIQADVSIFDALVKNVELKRQVK